MESQQLKQQKQRAVVKKHRSKITIPKHNSEGTSSDEKSDIDSCGSSNGENHSYTKKPVTIERARLRKTSLQGDTSGNNETSTFKSLSREPMNHQSGDGYREFTPKRRTYNLGDKQYQQQQQEREQEQEQEQELELEKQHHSKYNKKYTRHSLARTPLSSGYYGMQDTSLSSEHSGLFAGPPMAPLSLNLYSSPEYFSSPAETSPSPLSSSPALQSFYQGPFTPPLDMYNTLPGQCSWGTPDSNPGSQLYCNSPKEIELGAESPKKKWPVSSKDVLPSEAAQPFSSREKSKSVSLPEEDKDNVPVCRYFLIGHCFRGEHCKFRHEKPKSDKKKEVVQKVLENTYEEFPNADSLKDRVLTLCQSQKGCRLLQQLIDERDLSFHAIIFTKMLPRIKQVIVDQFGNYLCQKLIEKCNEEQRIEFIKAISKCIIFLCVNNFGTRVVQKLVDCLQTDTERDMVCGLLNDYIKSLINDGNGNHVVQRMLLQFPPKHTQFIYDVIAQQENIISIATHRKGCCVLQRCIEYATEEQKAQLIGEIISNALVLIADPFGNYVIQYIIEMPLEGVMEATINALLGHIAELSMQKHSSNVLEKIIKKRDKNDESVGNAIIEEVATSPRLLQLLKDPYANYVVQACFEAGNSRQVLLLVEAISRYESELGPNFQKKLASRRRFNE